MKQLSWKDITVQQFQEIYHLSLMSDFEEIDRIQRVMEILYNMASEEVENLKLTEFNQMAKKCGEVMKGSIPGKPVKQIKIGKRRYAINYNPTKLTQRQYVEVLHYGDKPIDHMHLIMASIVQPVDWLGRKLKNNAEQHEVIANEMLSAKVIDVYHACVFFCKLYTNLIETIKPYLIHEIMTKGATMEQAKVLLNTSQDVMAGFITPEKLQFLKI